LETLAKGLGVTRGRVSQMKAAGMPVDSLDSARAWRDEHVRPRIDNTPKGLGAVAAALAPDIAEARARREHHEANIAAMREHQMAGSLVELALVERALVGMTAQVRANLERVPDKLAEVVAAESDAHRIHALLVAEMDLVLEDLAAQVGGMDLTDARAVQ
jgi:phage terminase Nu1 subunit (DNA packaging protein)